ncbi:MAG: hypothetical protein JJE02_08065 [Propionibacteriales bacterium]|nr:hypothetical protein [Propionibacteriales bacterium]
MTKYTSVEQLIVRFLEVESHGKSAATKERYQRVVAHLSDFLDEVDVSRDMGTDPAALLESERQFEPKGAFFRLFDATDLVCCLPTFISERWLLGRLTDARTQVSLVGRLIVWLRRNRFVDMYAGGCAVWDAEAAVARARRAVGTKGDTHAA